MTSSCIDLNDQFRKALDLMEGGTGCLFITGKAGTGKSTLLSYFRTHTQKQVATLAPTGVAAVNIRGQTIHSFFGFRPDITIERARRSALRALRNKDADLYQKLDAVVIDEISMVRADLMDAVDAFLRAVRKKPKVAFGGLRLILIGDLYQLPPVVTSAEKMIFSEHYPSPYFFSAKVFPQIPLTIIELEKIYRQKDQRFIDLLNAVRNNSLTEDQVEELNARCLLQPEDEEEISDTLRICLTSTNEQASVINAHHLSRLSGKLHTYDGLVEGTFDGKSMPTEPQLSLKEGAQVMLLNNDSLGRWVNGTMGIVVSLPRKEEDSIEIELDDGETVEVGPFQWEIFRYELDAQKKALTSETVGTFTQYPLKLAWAITIHKSQGKTFDRVVIDTGRGVFATGQMYVALSRCRSLEGMKLKRPFRKQQALVDWRIVKFLTGYQYERSEVAMPLDGKKDVVRKAIQEGSSLDIVYLKPNDEKSRRTIRPLTLGEMEYAGKPFLGLRGFCMKRQEERTFRLDRILEMRVV